LQKAIAILLITCVLMQSFSKLSIIASYELNKDFIASVLCINKKEPVNTCEGKCYLAKQLAQAEKHEHLPAGDLKTKADILFIQQIQRFRFEGAASSLTPESIYHPHTYTSPVFSVFTPPKV
jgi:hypothetical protein